MKIDRFFLNKINHQTLQHASTSFRAKVYCFILGDIEFWFVRDPIYSFDFDLYVRLNLWVLWNVQPIKIIKCSFIQEISGQNFCSPPLFILNLCFQNSQFLLFLWQYFRASVVWLVGAKLLPAKISTLLPTFCLFLYSKEIYKKMCVTI